jgi:hypothetical protein
LACDHDSDIADDDWMLRADLVPAFEAMIDGDLTFDALVYPTPYQSAQVPVAVSRIARGD